MVQQTPQLLAAQAVCLAAALLSFSVTSLTGLASTVDRLWSIIPVVFAAILSSNTKDVRALTMTACICLWGVRLTLNFHRKGGYNAGEEDYRWAVLRQKIPNKILWTLFSFSFISMYQMLLLLLITIPVYIASLAPVDWMWTDSVFFGLAIVALCGETLADQQQWDFQSEKHRLLKKSTLTKLPMPYCVGFLQDGLWQYSRHPNFFCEQAFWWCMAGMAIAPATSGSLPISHALLWTFLGAFLLTVLFIGSAEFSESISLKKYPLYSVYQHRVSRLLPWFAGVNVTNKDKPLNVPKE